MAWLGEHFNTLTGKISDFTKEVILNDGSDRLLPEARDDRFPRILPSVDEVSNLNRICQEKDSVIQQLFQQKEEMESSIVKLDDQHQEVVNELLALKQHLTEENKQLKKQLSEKRHPESDSYISQSSKLISNYLYSNEPDAVSSEVIDTLEKELNILTVLETYKTWCRGDVNDQQVLRLEQLKNLVEPLNDETGLKNSVVSKLDNYINFLNLICNHKTIPVPVVEELTLIIHNFCSEPRNYCTNAEDCDKNNVCTILGNHVTVCNEKVDAGIQTSQVSDCNQLSQNAVSQYCQTESVILNNHNQKSVTSVGTDGLKIKQEIGDCSEKSSVALQTDSSCKCEELERKLSKTIAEMNELKDSLREKETHFLSQLMQQRELTQNLENSIAAGQSVIAKKDQVIVNQSKDLASLRGEMESLHVQLHQVNQSSHPGNRVVGHCSGDGQYNFSAKEQLLISVQQKLKAVDLEKSKLLYVLNEKSQECSTLRAEVHRLTSIVASEKQALFKLQQDNQDLKQGKGSSIDVDLTKEALKDLSRLVRDKDLEIEALKEKTNSLAAVVQQSTPAADHVQSLIEEHEQFVKQIAKLKSEREKIMATYNSRDQECRQQQTEIQKLKSELESFKDKSETLQHQLQTVSQQYEEKQKFSLRAQDDILTLKQRVKELEQECLDTKVKCSELQNEMNSETMVTVSRTDLECKSEEIENLKTTSQDKDDLIHEKDCLIHELSQHVKSLKSNVERVDSEKEDLKKVNENHLLQLRESELAVKKIWDDKEFLSQRLSDKHSEVNLLKEMNERLSMTVKEKEFSVQSLEEKISSLSILIRGTAASPTSPADIDQILADSKEMYTKAQSFHRERDETLLALSQCQQEKEELKSEMQKMRATEDHLNSELDRLRKHLLQIEENYTNEALRGEAREKELRNQLAEVERTAQVSSSAVLDASHQANVQVASLQEQIAMIAGQRDRALAQLSGLEDKVQQYAASLSNLQLVLAQMQKVHEQKMKESEDKWKNELKKVEQRGFEFQKVIQVKQKQLEESSQILEAASRLSEKIDAKEEYIAQLKSELSKAESKLRSATQEIQSFKNNSEGKVDRVVMKSLVLGYFCTPQGQKSEVVRLLARVLDFNQQEMAKAGIVVGKSTTTIEHRGLLSSFFGRLPLMSGSSANRQQRSSARPERDEESNEQSFTTLFVKFLENESQPIVRMPLPAEEMARELTSKAKVHKHSPRNQLLAVTPETGSLLIGINSPSPTFIPVSQSEYSSPTILQQILE